MNFCRPAEGGTHAVARAPRPAAPPQVLALTLAAAITLGGSFARAQSGVPLLDRPRVVALALERAPDVHVADVRSGEARALEVGARAFATVNPELSVWAGPRQLPLSWSADLGVTLVWPLDVSGARGRRVALADAAVRQADAEAADVRRLATADALDAWVLARGAQERVRLESDRAALDDALLAVVRGRRAAGMVGDGDVALATLVQAQGAARLAVAQGERDALAEELRARLGIAANAPVTVGGELAPPEPPPLEALLAALERRPDVARANAALGTARADAALQGRLGTPVPRLLGTAGYEGEFYARAGVDIALPVYQRNQTNTAVAIAREATRQAERDTLLARADAELRAAYARYLAARAAYQALDAASAAIADAERLALRAYELGQQGLEQTVLVRREAAIARTTRLDALVAWARARVAVDRAAGTLP